MLVDFDILTVIIGFIIFIIVAFIFKFHCKKGNIYIFLSFIMFLYLLNVIKFTLFTFPIFSKWYEPNLFESINMIPFKGIWSKESLLNIIMLIPLGIGLHFLSRINNWKEILITALLSGVCIESLQFMIGLFLSRGFTFRFIDIFFGVMIGYCFLKIISGLFLKQLKYDDSGLNLFWKYVFAIAKSVTKSMPARVGEGDK